MPNLEIVITEISLHLFSFNFVQRRRNDQNCCLNGDYEERTFFTLVVYLFVPQVALAPISQTLRLGHTPASPVIAAAMASYWQQDA